ncbi:MAG: hypothetical protein ACJASF_001735 [Vicingaceae bacterium]|jgi:hypothetical protein
MRLVFLMCFLIGFLWLPAQTVAPVKAINVPSSSFYTPKNKTKNNKAFGDTLWSEDFAGGLPNGWTAVNNSAAISAFKWQWDTVYRPGQFSLNVSAINSTSSSNGFMLLPMDFWNTPINSGPGAYNADTYFQSPAIPINSSPSVELRLQQFYRFCCRNGAKVVAQVSVDNFQTFDEYDLNSLFVNQISSNVEFTSVNVSRTLAYQDTAYLRFYINGLSHYFWMIDDLALVEGDQGVEIESINFYQPQLAKGPFPLISPLNYLKDVGFKATVENVTGVPLSGVNLNIAVNQSRNSNGSPGAGLVYSTNIQANNNGSLTPFYVDTVFSNAPFFTPSLRGEYEVSSTATSNQFPRADSAELSFTVSDTVFGRDFNSPSGIIGTARNASMVQPNGDRVGSLFYIDSSQFNIQFNSISFYVSNDIGNIGSVIRPVIWEFNSDTAKVVGIVNAFGRELASSLDSFSITINDTNRWLTLKLDTGIAMTRSTNVGEFVVGWEMLDGSPLGYNFSVWNDYTAQIVAPDTSTFVSFGNSVLLTNWGSIKAAPMIRLNVKPLLVGLSETDLNGAQIKVHPNPSTGIFTLEHSVSIQTFEVYNVNGQKVQIELVNNQLDLSEQPKGIYLLRVLLESGEVVSKKLMKN